MKYVLCLLLLTVARCMKIGYAVHQHDVPQECEASSLGTNFMFGLIGYANIGTSTIIRLHITPVMQVAAHVRVTAPYINMDRTFTVSNYTVIPLNGTLKQYESGKQFKGIEVSSDVNISLAVLTGGGDIMEGVLALPVGSLGTRYTAASYIPTGPYSSEVLIAGVESDTDVFLSIVIDGHQNSNRTFRLQKFETYQLKANNDVSGSVVTSNKPVAVFSGSAVAQVPFRIGGNQYIAEQMIPTKYWTTQFIVPSVYPRKHFVLKLFADQDDTEIQYYNSTKHFAVYMNKGSMEELLFGTDPVVVIANKPISVIQYGHDGDHMDGDPFMANTQGISQYQDSYKFVTFKYYSGASNTIAITILKNSTSGLLLNGHSLSYWNAKNMSVSPPLDQYITLFVNVSYNSYYNLHHSGGIHFGAVIYGRYRTTVAYGYPLQLALIDSECSAQSHGYTQVSSTSATLPTNNPNHASQSNGSWCFNCDGMTHLQYCNEVVKCPDPNDVCYVQSYTRNLHMKLYRSGCTSPQKCNTSDGNGGCTECCTGNFCNKAGCGDNGLPPLQQRGPLCFDCTHKGEHEICTDVQLCHADQVCMIEKYEWGDNVYQHVMGCSRSDVIQCMKIGYAVNQHDVPQYCETSSLGTNFMFGLIGYQASITSAIIRLLVTPVTQVAAHVRVTAPYVNMDRTFTVSNYTVIPLNGTLLHVESGKQFKGIEVSSDVNISLAVMTGGGDMMEGVLALPVGALGTRYTAASYIPWNTYSSEVLIAGVESDTDVFLSTVIDGHQNSTRTFRLQKFETYQFKAKNDVSGSLVTSNKPVAVFSGSASVQVPVRIGDYQYIAEQMIPIKYWTTQFIVPSVYPRKHFVLKLFADQDNTEIQYYNSTKHFAVYMNKGSMEELLFGTDPVVVLANKPISVIQYGHDGDRMVGDPFMSTTQGISQYQDSYNFVTQNYYSYSAASNTVAITILKNSTSRLILNGHSLSYWNAKNVSVASPMDQYITLFVNVSYGSYFHLHHSGGIHFGAVIYGRYASTAYGYPLQLTLIDSECSAQSHGYTQVSSTSATLPTNNPNHASQSNGSWCFNCDGMTHLQYCNEVVKCPDPNDVCYVQSYTRNLHMKLYRSGCISPQKCNTSDGNGGCTECCTGSFCNKAGCGDNGLPPIQQRGPLCFDCTHKGEHEICTAVQLCHADQQCTALRSARGLTARQLPVCTHCCREDFCNMNCTAVNVASAIVG